MLARASEVYYVSPRRAGRPFTSYGSGNVKLELIPQCQSSTLYCDVTCELASSRDADVTALEGQST